VVFLAAYGGLAVLAGGSSSDPNPYVLFVTCLVGAVYSEAVWRWARTKLVLKEEAAKAQEEARKPNEEESERDTLAIKDKVEVPAEEKKNSDSQRRREDTDRLMQISRSI
jgi:hypothetical protein